MNRTLIFGCGYVGARIARRLREDGWEAYAVTRSSERAEEWTRAGWQAIRADVTQPETLADLPEVDVLYFAVGYDPRGAATRQQVYVDGLSNVLRAMTGRCGRVVAISSTSVYGQQHGEEVDEDSATTPAGESGEVCLAAERALWDWASGAGQGSATMLLRFAGLYGPGRLLARLDALHRGVTMPGRGDAWLNLIHAEDAARLAIRCAERGRAGRTYLGSDQEPVRREEFYRQLAELAGAPPPAFDPDADGARGSARGLNKRCNGSRTRDELEFRFEFPTYREGLADALSAAAGVGPAATPPDPESAPPAASQERP
ncbi:MAG: SDR family oxidoreductase [Planctomyces sp.]|nr:SDR family oxidoreductase [Planctomyces sp.]